MLGHWSEGKGLVLDTHNNMPEQSRRSHPSTTKKGTVGAKHCHGMQLCRRQWRRNHILSLFGYLASKRAFVDPHISLRDRHSFTQNMFTVLQASHIHSPPIYTCRATQVFNYTIVLILFAGYFCNCVFTQLGFVMVWRTNMVGWRTKAFAPLMNKSTIE